jgi:hypothetical protein
MKAFRFELIIGAALMSWGGASITNALGFSGWRQMDVPIFAIGIIVLAQAQNRSLVARIRDLENGKA